MRNGNTALLNNINLDFIGIKLRSLIRTPILWLAFLQIEIICSEKFSLESNTTPRSMKKEKSFVYFCVRLMLDLRKKYNSRSFLTLLRRGMREETVATFK